MRIAIDCNGRKYMTSEPDRTSPTPLFNAFVKEQVEKEQMAQAGITDSGSWHNGYRAACKDICERFGLDNTDEIELLVKERDALKTNNELMDKEFVRLNDELQKAEHAAETYAKSNDDYRQELYEAQKDLELFRVFAVDVNDLRAQVLIKDCEIARLKAELAEARKVVDAAKNLANVKGRHNSEIAMKRLIEAMQGKDE